jgi:DNA-directed RNA polymerase subunit delta
MEKKKAVTEYHKLSEELLKLYDETYPTGIAGRTIRFPNSKGEIVTAVRLETDDTIYLVKVSAKPKEILTEEQMDELIKPSAKDAEEGEGEQAEEEEEEDDSDKKRRSSDDDEE